MCTSPHSMTEELKMYLPSVGSFLVRLFSFRLLQPQIGSPYFLLPPSESRVLFISLEMKVSPLPLTFLRLLNFGTISASRINSLKDELE